MEQITIAQRNNPFRRFGRRVLQSKYLIMMILPAIVFYVVFCYLPMYGVVLAFKSFNPIKGIVASPWVGFNNFKEVFNDPNFWPVFVNPCFVLNR